ncbi:hypothetical protein GCM10027613_04120 [Microlunatus endophyticus]
MVIATLSPRGELAGKVAGLYKGYAAAAAKAGARLVVVGGFSSLRPAADRPRFTEGDIPEQFRDEALEMESFRVWITSEAPEELDWLFFSPAGAYGSYAPGRRPASTASAAKSHCSPRTASRSCPARTSRWRSWMSSTPASAIANTSRSRIDPELVEAAESGAVLTARTAPGRGLPRDRVACEVVHVR